VAHIVVLICDAKLGAELAAAAEAAGHEIDVCAGEAETWDACEERTELLVVDASGEAADGVSLVDSMRAGGELVGVRTVAVYGDADSAAKARAEAIGFDLVLARSHVEANGVRLFADLLA
jgi:DNA-binding response OmpR family regulator